MRISSDSLVVPSPVTPKACLGTTWGRDREGGMAEHVGSGDFPHP